MNSWLQVETYTSTSRSVRIIYVNIKFKFNNLRRHQSQVATSPGTQKQKRIPVARHITLIQQHLIHTSRDPHVTCSTRHLRQTLPWDKRLLEPHFAWSKRAFPRLILGVSEVQPNKIWGTRWNSWAKTQTHIERKIWETQSSMLNSTLCVSVMGYSQNNN